MVASKSSQDFVPVKEVRDGVLILKDGSIRRILMASSLNFALKSAPEQESIIYQFQTFLNSIDFSVQIFIQSRRYDIRPYLAILEEREREQLNDLLKIQTREYINFIQEFMEMTNIMTKNFLSWCRMPRRNLLFAAAVSRFFQREKCRLESAWKILRKKNAVGSARVCRAARACALRRPNRGVGDRGSH